MKKNVYFIVLSLLVMMLFIGCQSTDQSQTGGTDQQDQAVERDDSEDTVSQVLIIGVESELDILDPHRAGGWSTYRVNRQIYESLVEEELTEPADVPPLKPALATSWDISSDGTVYTFELRQGVKFHDGSDFNADAVEFNVRRAWDENFEYYDAAAAGQLFHTYRFLKDVEVVDDYTIKYIMEQPFSPFIRMLSQGGMGSAGILSPTALKEHGQDGIGQNPVGTGPFVFKERELGQKIELVRNEDYWGEKPYLDTVIFRPIPDAAARVTALETGQVDVISVVPPDSVEQLQAAGFNVEMGTPPHVWYLQFNMQNELMQDYRVRQAIAMAINREGMAESLLRGTADPASGIQSPGNEAYDPDFVDFEYNPDKARELLEEAGFGDGLQMTYRLPIDGSGQLIPVPMAEWIQQDLAQVGINLTLDTEEWNTFLNLFGIGEIPTDISMISTSWGFTTPYWLYIAAHYDSGANLGRYNNPEVNELIEKAILEPNPEKAIDYWKEVNVIVSRDDPAYVGIVNDKAPYAMADYVEGFIVPSEEWYDLFKVRITN